MRRTRRSCSRCIEGEIEEEHNASEAQQAKPLASPCTPSSAEVEAHSLTHLPYRSWCVHCVRAKGPAGAHKTKEEETEMIVPKLSIDYLFAGQAKDKRPLTGLCFLDKKSKRVSATLVPKKGTSESPYSAKWLAHQVEFPGYPRVIVKSDQEKSIIDLKKTAKILVASAEMAMEESPVTDSKSNGEIEAINGVLGQIRVLKDHMDYNYKENIKSEHPILSWLAPFAPWTHYCFHIGEDGKTAHERLRGKRMNKDILGCAECCHYKPTKMGKRLAKMDVNWSDGIFLGVSEKSSEFFVMDSEGSVVKCRDIKRKVVEERYNIDELNKFKSTPWQPSPGSEEVGPAATARPIGVKDESIPAIPIAMPEPVARRHYLTKGIVEKFGATSGCEGCARNDRAHNETCRKRLMRAIDEDDVEKERFAKSRATEATKVMETIPEEEVHPDGDVGMQEAGSEPSGSNKDSSTSGSTSPSSSSSSSVMDMSMQEQKKRPAEDPAEEEEANKMEVERTMTALLNEEETEIDWEEMDLDFEDEITGAPLLTEDVIRAHQDEMQEHKNFDVYDEVEEELCWQLTGGPPVGSRLRVINKGDENQPDVRARPVAKQFKLKGWEPIFAATPPLSLFKYLFSRVTSTRAGRTGKPRKIMIIDLKRAFFHAMCSKDTFVKPPHLKGTTRCWKLKKAMYGTLSAAGDFQNELGETMVKEIKANQALSSPCAYYIPEQDLGVVCHGDDIVCEGEDDDLDWFEQNLSNHFELTVKAKMGPEAHDCKQAPLPNRVLTWTEGGLEYEADPRHAELIIAELGLVGSRPQVTPGVEHTREEIENSPLLKDDLIKSYRAITARTSFLAQDRIDIACASKECCRGMSALKEVHLKMIKRIGRYLEGRRRMVQVFKFQNQVYNLDVECDSDRAGCPMSRRSTSGGVIMHGKNTIAHWSSTQSLVSLSSAESGYTSLLKGGTEGLGTQSLILELGDPLQLVLWTDSSAGRSIANRQGHGKVKHIEIKDLWLQQSVKHKKFRVNKIAGTENSSDILTKNVPRALLDKHLEKLGFVDRGGRASKAPKLSIDMEAMSKNSVMLASMIFMARCGVVEAVVDKKVNDSIDLQGLAMIVVTMIIALLICGISFWAGWYSHSLCHPTPKNKVVEKTEPVMEVVKKVYTTPTGE